MGLPLTDALRAALVEHIVPLQQASPQLRWLPRADWHLTLRFVGAWPRLKLPGLERAFDRIKTHALELRVDGLAPFPVCKPVVLAALLEATAALQQQVRAIDLALRGCGLESEPRALRPHISLARGQRSRLQRVSARSCELSFAATRLALFESRSGVEPGQPRYRVLRHLVLPTG